MTKRDVVGLVAVVVLTAGVIFAQGPANGRRSRMGKGPMAGIRAATAAKMFAVLTPEQREKAQKLRQSFGGHGFGPMGFQRRGGKLRAPQRSGNL